MGGGRRARRGVASAPATASEVRTYAEALRYLDAHINLEKEKRIRDVPETFRLDRIREILKRLGDPQEHLRLVHVAGTKGKGSTVAMTAAGLRGCGLAVGTFTSPHLVDVRERFCINGSWISEADFVRCLREAGTAAEETAGPLEAHYFEVQTAMALLYFAYQAVDVAVIEVGLGGRLDSTNVITPVVCGITQISYDHTNILGTTLDAIAREKGGILKSGVPAFAAPQEEEAEAALRACAVEAGAPLKIMGRDYEFTSRCSHEQGQGLSVWVGIGPTGPGSEGFDHVRCPLRGEHQAVNCGLALSMIRSLRADGLHLPTADILEGLSQATIAGRMELVSRKPPVLIDGAHNAASVSALVRAIGAYYQPDALVAIFGCNCDKDVDGMLRALQMGADKVIFTKARGNFKAMEPEDLQHRYQTLTGKSSQVARNLDEAITLATRAISSRELICVTGSFYLAGEGRKRYVGRRGEGALVETKPAATLRTP